ncbi:MAG TPA: type II secretion system F family protein [Desulfotignum sp.]|nr:type II secretion system F family protein [Desulfotignum sp.]
MDFMIISAVIFFTVLIIIELSLRGFRNLRSTQRAKLKKRLSKFTFTENSAGDIIKTRKLSDIPFLNRLLLSSSIVRNLDQLVLQANVKLPLSVYVLAGLFLGTFSGMIVMFVLDSLIIAGLVGLVGLFLPYPYLTVLKNRRAKKFQAQLHEGLDMIARALRSGHSFTSSLQLAADEFDDPLGTEFEETIDEINFGVSVPVALKNLMNRVACREIKFFVMSVIIQRETGGNLAALIESLAHILRERFRFQGNVRTLSAEGRLSAVILILLPFVIAFFVFFSNPSSLQPLIEEPVGWIMLGAAGVGMVIGAVVMKNMVDIDV